jgi:hypothetical protein
VSPRKQLYIGPSKLAHFMGLLEEYELALICLFVRLGHVPTLHINLAATFSSQMFRKTEMLSNITWHQTFWPVTRTAKTTVARLLAYGIIVQSTLKKMNCVRTSTQFRVESGLKGARMR